MSYKNWTEEQKAAYMLDALSREDLSSDVLELIQGWMLGGDSAAGKEKALDAALDRLFDEVDSRPKSRTYESLARLHERIGLPAPEIRALGIRAPEMPTPGSAPLRRSWLRVAAVVVPLSVLAGALWLTRKHSSDTAPLVAVTKTMTKKMAKAPTHDDGVMTLPDGSVVVLIGDAEIAPAENFTENRHVKFSGEAFFSVVKNPERPFTVETDRLTVTVLGTEFNLKAYPGMEDTAVSLVSGRVEVTDKRGKTVLDPMEQLIYDKETGESVVEEFSPEQIDHWRSGEQMLDDVSLEEALRAVADFYGKEIVIKGILPHGLRVTTILKNDSTAASALEAIRLIDDAFTYSVGEDTIYIH